jgi:hypothetical protein
MRKLAWMVLVMLMCACIQTPPTEATPTVAPPSTSVPTTAVPTQSGSTATSKQVATTAPTVAPTRPPTSAPTPLPGGSIRGSVTTFSARGSVPSANTAVELRPEVPIDPSDPPLASTHTDNGGQYMLARVQNGRYLLTAGGGGIGSPQANVTIAGSDLLVDLQLEPVAAALVHKLLTGRVVDSSSRPVSGASVWLSGGSCHANTGSDGAYSMSVILDSGGQRVLNATTSAQSGFVLVADSATQPTIQLTRPAATGVPSDICPTTVGLQVPTPTPAPGRVVTVLRTAILPRLAASVVPKP